MAPRWLCCVTLPFVTSGCLTKNKKHFPQTVLALTRSYLGSIVIPLEIRIAGGQPKYLSLKYLSPAANSLEIRIAGGQPHDKKNATEHTATEHVFVNVRAIIVDG